MNHRIQLSVLLASMLALAVSPALGQSKGKEFPNFTGKHLVTGEFFSLEDLRGKIVLVDFWATWCPPCIVELPNVKKTYAKYHDKGFEIISISLDTDINKCKRYAKKQNMDWYHISEGGGWETRLATKFNIRSIPAMFLLDGNGVVVSTEARGDALGRAIESAMKRTPPTLGAVGSKRADEALVKADELRDAEEYVEAAAAYDKITKKYSGSDAAGIAAEHRSEMLADETIAAAIEKAETDRKNARAAKRATSWMEMARSLAKAKKYDSARKYYNRVLKAVPGTELAVEAKHEMSKLR